jgi:hypothetical protein
MVSILSGEEGCTHADMKTTDDDLNRTRYLHGAEVKVHFKGVIGARNRSSLMRELCSCP